MQIAGRTGRQMIGSVRLHHIDVLSLVNISGTIALSSQNGDAGLAVLTFSFRLALDSGLYSWSLEA